MSLTTEDIIGGMYRAHRAGQPFAALTANPQFANLPMEQKQEVLAGLRSRMGGGSTSTVNAISSLLRSTAGGALGAIPLGAAIPLALEMSEGGATKKSVIAALKGASENKRVRMLVGTGMVLGAGAGLLNSALGLYRTKRDHESFQDGLEAASKGGEDFAAATFGSIGGRSGSPNINLAPVTHALGKAAVPSAVASARLYHYNELGSEYSPDWVTGLEARVKQKIMQGHPVQPERLDELVKHVRDNQKNFDTMQNIVVNSHQDLNLEPEDANGVLGDIAGGMQQNEDNIQNLTALSGLARRVRDMKRGDQ